MDYMGKEMNIAGLAEEVLKELPDQIVSYMMANQIKPHKQEWNQIDQLNLSLA
jgi:hypothetical protein